MIANKFAEIILGSGSPRRRQILEALGIPHKVLTADVDERSLTARNPREFALKAALTKASALDTIVPKDKIVVAADTVVSLEGEIFFKPVDRADAISMLKKLSGKTHQVITGVAVREVSRATQLDAVTTHVTIRTLSSREIEDYVDSGEPMDKAGSYGIQGVGQALVEKIDGDYFNVVGLPVFCLLNMLEAHGDVELFRHRSSQLSPKIFQS